MLPLKYYSFDYLSEARKQRSLSVKKCDGSMDHVSLWPVWWYGAANTVLF